MTVMTPMTVNCRRILDARLVCHPRWLSSITETDSTLVLAFLPVLSAVNPALSYWPLGGSPLSPRSPLYGRGFWICGRDTCVFSRVYGVGPRRCCGFVVTAVIAPRYVTRQTIVGK